MQSLEEEVGHLDHLDDKPPAAAAAAGAAKGGGDAGGSGGDGAEGKAAAAVVVAARPERVERKGSTIDKLVEIGRYATGEAVGATRGAVGGGAGEKGNGGVHGRGDDAVHAVEVEVPEEVLLGLMGAVRELSASVRVVSDRLFVIIVTVMGIASIHPSTHTHTEERTEKEKHECTHTHTHAYVHPGERPAGCDDSHGKGLGIASPPSRARFHC